MSAREIMKSDATGDSYPIANELRLKVGLNETKREVKKANLFKLDFKIEAVNL